MKFLTLKEIMILSSYMGKTSILEKEVKKNSIQVNLMINN